MDRPLQIPMIQPANNLHENLRNFSLQTNSSPNLAPILLVCYTNHALDQFLCELMARLNIAPYKSSKSILDNGIVRIGGRCKEESLQKYTLKALRLQLRRERKVPGYIFHGTIIILYSYIPHTI